MMALNRKIEGHSVDFRVRVADYLMGLAQVAISCKVTVTCAQMCKGIEGCNCFFVSAGASILF